MPPGLGALCRLRHRVDGIVSSRRMSFIRFTSTVVSSLVHSQAGDLTTLQREALYRACRKLTDLFLDDLRKLAPEGRLASPTLICRVPAEEASQPVQRRLRWAVRVLRPHRSMEAPRPNIALATVTGGVRITMRAVALVSPP